MQSIWVSSDKYEWNRNKRSNNQNSNLLDAPVLKIAVTSNFLMGNQKLCKPQTATFKIDAYNWKCILVEYHVRPEKLCESMIIWFFQHKAKHF